MRKMQSIQINLNLKKNSLGLVSHILIAMTRRLKIASQKKEYIIQALIAHQPNGVGKQSKHLLYHEDTLEYAPHISCSFSFASHSLSHCQATSTKSSPRARLCEAPQAPQAVAPQ